MNPASRAETWIRVTTAFDQAVSLPESGRQAFVDDLERQDPAVAREIASLLRFHTPDESGFLSEPIGPKIAQALVEKEMPSFRDGDRVGDFHIAGLLGQGSFAKVYLAHQVSLGRPVALKVSSNIGEEARTMANLEHENIVQVFSQTIDEAAGTRMICMQYVPGCTLETALKLAFEKSLPLSGRSLLTVVDECSSGAALFNAAALKDRATLEALDPVGAVTWLGIRLADALAYAHKKGVLHLDIKPGNILITPYGRPMLTDFNVSVDSKAGEDAHMLGGTLNYMSPEHLKAFDGEADFSIVDARSDLFSLGVLLKEMLRRAAGTEAAGEEGRALTRILDRCTRPDPDARYATAGDLSKALSGCLEQQSIENGLPTPGPLVRLALDSPMWTVALVVLVAQIIASAVNILYNHARIVSHLTADQLRFFEFLCLGWNPVIFGVSFAVLIRVQLQIHRFCEDPENVIAQGPDALARMRRMILADPLWIVGVSTVAWGLAALFFPVTLDVFKGPVPGWVYTHFFISFLLSWLIAITYSFLLSQYLLLRVVYPRAWVGCSQVRETARRELKPIGPRMSVFHTLAGCIPLVGAMVLIFTQPHHLSEKDFQTYRLLLVLLIGTGMAGFFFALKTSVRLSRILHALTGQESGQN